MRPQYLVIEGLRSYRDKAEITFSKLGLTAFIGDTGAGKSSIIEALTVALYNRPTWPAVGRNVQALRADGAPAMRVDLTFTVGDGPHRQTWRVVRIHKANATPPVHKLECVETGEKVDGERTINPRLQALIGLTYEQFIRAVVIPQGQFAKLLEQGSSQTEILKGIFRLDHLDVVKKHADLLFKRYAEPVAERRGWRKALPHDPVADHAAAETALKTAAERANSLLAAVGVADQHAEQAKDLRSAARSLAGAADRIGQHSHEEHVAALARAVEADAEITRACRQAAGDRQRAKAKAEQDRRAAAGALAPFPTRDSAVEGRAALYRAAQVAPALAERAKELALEDKRLADPAAAAARDGLRQEAENAGREADKAAEAFGVMRAAEETASKKAQSLAALVRTAHKVVSGLESALEAARRSLDTAMHANALAAAAGHCQPGDSCPICARPLPEGFVPPTDPDIEAARGAHAAATAEWQRARAAAREAADEAQQAADELDEQRKRTQQAAEAKALAGQKAQTAERNARSAADAHAAAVAQHEKDIAELARSRAEVEATLAALPDLYRATLADLATLDKALALLTAALTTAVQHEAAAKEADGCAEEADHVERKAAGRLDTEVRQPCTTARAGAAVLAAAVGEVHRLLDTVGPVVPAAPVPDASPAEVAAWLEGLHAAAAIAAAAADAAARQRDTGAASEDAHAVALAAAHGAPDLETLHKLAEEANGEVALARREVREAARAVVAAQRLDALLAVGEPFVANLSTLSQTLTNSRFIGALVAERQRELLVDASRKLRELTGNNFGFAEGFRIVDRRTGQQRPPETLSGGERFLASLALALGLVEIATRGGGQLDALFIDEGFGSLDSTSLDQALSTLGNLAVGGRLVALVSHLRRVAEHVDQVLLVERDDVLGSRVRLLTPDERDELLAEDARSGLTV